LSFGKSGGRHDACKGQGLRKSRFLFLARGYLMQIRWTGKSVDLDSLSNGIAGFFQSRDFLTGKIESADERRILLRPKYPTIKLQEPISVGIVGSSDDFTIDLRASELATRSIRMGMLTKSFGGGCFQLKGLKLQEELKKLENDFWVYIESKIASMASPSSE
jgi:hypothetical protein